MGFDSGISEFQIKREDFSYHRSFSVSLYAGIFHDNRYESIERYPVLSDVFNGSFGYCFGALYFEYPGFQLYSGGL